MMRSLYSGVAGLKTHQTGMDVVGNNIANVNTTGFKSFRATYQDTLYQTSAGASQAQNNRGGTNPIQIGLGVGNASIDKMFKDGSPQNTSSPYDLCLSGDGLFIVKDGSGEYYTRNGAFRFDGEGNYVNSAGQFVMGWMGTDGVVNTNGAAGIINIPSGKPMAAKETANATYSNNLNAASPIVTNISGGTITSPTIKATADYPVTITLSNDKIMTATSGNFTTADYTSTTPAVQSIYGGESFLRADATNPVTILINDNATPSSMITLTADSGDFKVADYNGSTPVTVTGISDNSGNVAPNSPPITAGANNQVTFHLSDGRTMTASSGTFDVSILIGNSLPIATSATIQGNTQILKADSNKPVIVTLADSNTNKVTADSGEFNVAEYPPSTTATVTVKKGISGGEGTVVQAKPGNAVTLTRSDGTKVVVDSGVYRTGYSVPITTTLTVYDSLGNDYTVPVMMSKRGTTNDTWSVYIESDSGGIGGDKTFYEEDGKTPKIQFTMAETEVVFNKDGAYSDGSGFLSFYPKGYGEADDGNVTIDFSSLTQYAGSNTVKGTADGYAAGTLTELNFDSSGAVIGTYTNGIIQKEAVVAIAQFNNNGGLTAVGSTLFQKSNNSGEPNVKTATDLGCTITPSALEMSNVDLAQEFSTMIVTQRGFQSNSKIITVSDEMLETLVQMKR